MEMDVFLVDPHFGLTFFLNEYFVFKKYSKKTRRKKKNYKKYNHSEISRNEEEEEGKRAKIDIKRLFC